jgi:hypothetical protein
MRPGVAMNNKRFLLQFFASIIFLQFTIHAQTDSSSALWTLDRLDNIGGYLTTLLPNDTSWLASELPMILNTEQGKAAYFNGKNDGFLVKGSPLRNTAAWTFEVIFKPDSSSNSYNLEQRFLHIAQNSTAAERLLFEIRLLKNQKWAFDLYLSSGKRSLVLLDTIHTATLHTANQWHHVAVVYENIRATTYIDGVRELSDTVTYHPPVNAQTSIGARQNPRSWFKGAIRLIKATPRALTPSEFLNIPAPTEIK